MELGERLRQARLEAGLSQRQLCGQEITRNMLSQIENGSARPSMDTLRYLAQQLGKPVSFFLEEQAVSLPNQSVMEQARQAQAEQALELLEQYQGPDPVYDPERWLLEALTCLKLAGQAIGQKKYAYGRSLLERMKTAGEKTPYYTQELERSRLLLCFEAGQPAAELEAQLPQMDTELLLRAQAALEQKDAERCARLLDAMQERTELWHYLRGQAYEQSGQYEKAAGHYLQAEDSKQVYACLERCYRELEDYKRAYEYACRQKK